MPTSLRAAISSYARAANLAHGTRAEYQTTLTKWQHWGHGVPLERLSRKEIREFLDWVYEQALADQGANPGRTTNKARTHLRAISHGPGIRISFSPFLVSPGPESSVTFPGDTI